MLHAVTSLILTMKAANVKRVKLLSAFGVSETFVQANFIQKLIFRLPLKNIYSDKTKADTMLCNSALDWTIVCPAKLTDGLYTGKYEAAEKLPMKGMPKISRSDVTDFMLRQLIDDNFLKKIAILMN